MISTYDKHLAERISADLLARGFKPKRLKEKKKISASEFSGSFLNVLFPFPYLDFAFVRYSNEIQSIEIEEQFYIFGFCDFGLIARNSSDCVVVIDEEEDIKIVADSVVQFVERYHLLIYASTNPHGQNQKDIDSIEAFGGPFWEEIAYALSAGDAAPRRHLLAALKDEVVTEV